MTMMKRMGRWSVGLLIVLLALAAALGGNAEVAEDDGANAVRPHNYILIIDNSLSTSGRHSLGGATDPVGLRFDAAQLVYQNVVSAAATGSKGKLGVIVFCGPRNCVSYGPVDIDDEAMDDKIGKYLNAAANEGRRDVYTDIRTALETAQEMMAGFEGDTSVILLSDGVNDLTNRSDPFSRPENIKANEQCAEIVEQMRAEGVDFHIIALTSRDDVKNTDAFMVFINRLAKAGGGAVGDDGEYSNVLMATQTDLNSKLVQMLIKAESASQSIQTIVGNTPVEDSFTVPYDGINDATVNVTFMPEDKALLETVALVDPNGERRVVWDAANGIHEDAGIAVTESRSYIMVDIPAPEAGAWRLDVTSREAAESADSRVLVNAVVRFNHNLRVAVKADEEVELNKSFRIDAWLQTFNGETYEDLTDSDIYTQSKAVLTVFTPSGNQKSLIMKQSGDRYTVRTRMSSRSWTTSNSRWSRLPWRQRRSLPSKKAPSPRRSPSLKKRPRPRRSQRRSPRPSPRPSPPRRPGPGRRWCPPRRPVPSPRWFPSPA